MATKRRSSSKRAGKSAEAKSTTRKANGANGAGRPIDDPDVLIKYYRDMLLIRRFEERAGQMYGMGLIGGFCHLYIGQEAVIVGMVAGSVAGDTFITSYRDHGHMLASGMDPKGVMAELTGRAGGYSRGKGGSMHMFSAEKKFYGGHGIVGAQVPIGAGLAFANKYRGNDNVSLAYFGDGASNQGIFHEALNLAAVWDLPMIFVCENNQYALSTSYRETTSVERISQRAQSYDIPGITIDGNDAVEVYLVMQEAIDRARAGEGPTLVEAMTYRWGQHSMRVNLRDPRPEDEINEWMARDPIQHMEKVLSYIEMAKNSGATLIAGGNRITDGDLGAGCFVQPTIFADCTNEMKHARDEIFGPVMSVMRFKNEAEVIDLANDSNYGLAAGIFTRDLSRAHRVIAKLQAGICWINTYGDSPAEMPVGGYKHSGIGRENGVDSIRHYTQIKSVFVSLDKLGNPFA